MITAVAICPHPPLLFRELTGQQDIAAELREASLTAVERVTRAAPDRVVVFGGADESLAWDPALLPVVRTLGTTGARERAGLPLSLGVGRRLLDSAGWTGPVEPVSISWEAPADEVQHLAGELAAGPGRTSLVVLADGSARRGEAAPGHLDERAIDFDLAIGSALAGGDAQALLEMDVDLARELMVGGRAAFQVMAAVVRRQGGRPKPTILFDGDPFGVSYFVATWEMH